MDCANKHGHPLGILGVAAPVHSTGRLGHCTHRFLAVSHNVISGSGCLRTSARNLQLCCGKAISCARNQRRATGQPLDMWTSRGQTCKAGVVFMAVEPLVPREFWGSKFGGNTDRVGRRSCSSHKHAQPTSSLPQIQAVGF